MQVIITFNTDNAAFEDAGMENEISGILKGIADRVLDYDTDFPILDHNGNTIGNYRHWLGAND